MPLLDENFSSNPPEPSQSPSISNTNKWAIIVGLLLFIVASVMIVSPRIVSQTTIVWPLFLACAALGVVMAAVGSEAKIAKPGSTITGAAAIALILFFILMKAIGDAAPRYRGSLLVRGADPRATLAMLEAANPNNPIKASINYKTDSSDGVARTTGQMKVFDFTLDANGAYRLNDENCPSLFIEFADHQKRIWRFAKSKMIPADYNNFFQLEFIVDRDKLYFDNGPASNELKSCDASAEKIISEETNTKSAPPTGLAHDTTVAASPSVATSVAPKAAGAEPNASAFQPPSPPASPSTTVAEDIKSTKVVGYVVALQLSPDSKVVKKSWFDIDGKPNARFPVPGDVLTAVRDKVNVYPEPYRWDPSQRKHLVPKSFMTLAMGQKIRIGGDPFLAKDEYTAARYVISPVIEVIGASVPRDKELFPPAVLPDGIKGYVYLGYLDADGANYVSKTFDNYSNPGALYPSPGDILVATTNVWMRGGPRRWDAVKNDYVNAPTKEPIAEGQYVQVGGDTFLAKGGLSVWVPIAKIYTGGLAEVARQ